MKTLQEINRIGKTEIMRIQMQMHIWFTMAQKIAPRVAIAGKSMPVMPRSLKCLCGEELIFQIGEHTCQCGQKYEFHFLNL